MTSQAFKNSSMKKYIDSKIVVALLIVLVSTVRCSEDFPIDEDGLLITSRGSCFVSNF
jgi:hypothetical protein